MSKQTQLDRIESKLDALSRLMDERTPEGFERVARISLAMEKYRDELRAAEQRRAWAIAYPVDRAAAQGGKSDG